MKILNIYRGNDPYSFDEGFYHYTAKFDPSDTWIAAQLKDHKSRLEKKHILWYALIIEDIDPESGAVSTTVLHEAGKPKKVRVLNEKAKQENKEATYSESKLKAAIAGLTPTPESWILQDFTTTASSHD